LLTNKKLKEGEIMIVDCHTHLDFSLGDKQNPAYECPNLFKLLNAMKRTGVDKVGLIHSPVPDNEYFFWREKDIIRAAERTLDIISKYPDKFFTLLWLNPILPAEFNIKMIERYIVNGPIDGVKLHIQMNTRDKRMEPLAEAIQAHGIPVLIHAWYKTVQKYKYECDPSDIADLASRFPEMKILMAHLTGCRKRGVQDIKKYKNIWIDTAGSQAEDGFLEYAIDELGADRILFGSDFDIRDIATQLGRIYSVDMDDKTREKILSGNALKFFTKGGVKA
jgi:predicted TIM-barrel fold metal-dependent hydrolase